jgi:hypothetical protein
MFPTLILESDRCLEDFEKVDRTDGWMANGRRLIRLDGQDASNL